MQNIVLIFKKKQKKNHIFVFALDVWQGALSCYNVVSCLPKRKSECAVSCGGLDEKQIALGELSAS